MNPRGEWVTMRQPNANPRDLRCAPHLRRSCGTCKHFAGTLRGPADRCQLLGLVNRPGTSAHDCEFWSRRG